MNNIIRLPDGNYVTEDVFGVAQEIKARWGDRLKIQYADPDKIEIADAPYRLVEYNQVTKEWEVVMEVWSLDRSVIERLQMLEMFPNYSWDKMIKGLEDKKKKSEEAWKETGEEAADLVKHAFRTSRRYSFKNKDGEKVVLD